MRDDPRYRQNYDRVGHRDQLAADLASVFAQRSVAQWVEALLAAGIPAGPINDYGQALASDHAQARGVAMKVPHPVEGEFNALGFAAKLSDTPARVRRHPPLLGEHQDELLAEIGLATEAARLRGDGAFAQDGADS